MKTDVRFAVVSLGVALAVLWGGAGVREGIVRGAGLLDASICPSRWTASSELAADLDRAHAAFEDCRRGRLSGR